MPRSRREKGHYGHAYRRMRAEVFARSITCYLCGEAVDKGLYWRLPGAPQLHLIIPLTRGGSWRDRNNAVLTHRLCNIRQSNRLEGEERRTAATRHQWDDRWIVAEDP